MYRIQKIFIFLVSLFLVSFEIGLNLIFAYKYKFKTEFNFLTHKSNFRKHENTHTDG